MGHRITAALIFVILILLVLIITRQTALRNDKAREQDRPSTRNSNSGAGAGQTGKQEGKSTSTPAGSQGQEAAAALPPANQRETSAAVAGADTRPSPCLVPGSDGRYKSAAPGSTPSETNMLFMIVQFTGKHASLVSSKIVQGTIHLDSDFKPEDGVYHRILAADGTLLAHAVTPEPRLIFYDVPVKDGSNELTGGTLVASNITVAVRYPVIQGMDRVEFYEIGKTTLLQRLDGRSGECCGSFKLPAAEM